MSRRSTPRRCCGRAAAGALALTTLAGRALAAEGAPLGPTFGRGYVRSEGLVCRGEGGEPDTVVLNHTLAPGSTHGVLHYFWATGKHNVIDRVWVSYFLDGEDQPSIRFQPSMACGVAFPELLKPTDLFSAGGLCGRSGNVGGFHHSIPVPFARSIVVTVAPDPVDGKCTHANLNLRGTENLPLALPGSPVPLPPSARLRLHRNDGAVRQPLEQVPLMEEPRGRQGVVAMTAFAVQARPVGGVGVGGGYIEGCWQFYRSFGEAPPGVVVGTGVEDYFGSAYYFGLDAGQRSAQTFASEQAGLTVLDRDAASGVESLSAYRVHLNDPLVFMDGGRLQWQVGAKNVPGFTKCGVSKIQSDGAAQEQEPPLAGPAGPGERQLSPVNLTTYAWVYSWPADVATEAALAPAPTGAAAETAGAMIHV